MPFIWILIKLFNFQKEDSLLQYNCTSDKMAGLKESFTQRLNSNNQHNYFVHKTTHKMT